MDSPYFKPHELACRCGCGDTAMDPGFMARLHDLRVIYGKPMAVSSAKRCAQHNQAVSVTGQNGPHVLGRAADIAVSRKNAHELLRLALNAGFTGIGIRQHGKNRFIHLDDLEKAPQRPRPTVWSYP